MAKGLVSRLFVAIVVGTLWLGIGPQAIADDAKVRSVGPTKTSDMTIHQKTNGGLITKERRLVRISRYTEYFDQTGKKIDFASFAAPCKAVIVYEPEPKGDPVAVSVTVKELLPGATRLIDQNRE